MSTTKNTITPAARAAEKAKAEAAKAAAKAAEVKAAAEAKAKAAADKAAAALEKAAKAAADKAAKEARAAEKEAARKQLEALESIGDGFVPADKRARMADRNAAAPDKTVYKCLTAAALIGNKAVKAADMVKAGVSEAAAAAYVARRIEVYGAAVKLAEVTAAAKEAAPEAVKVLESTLFKAVKMLLEAAALGSGRDARPRKTDPALILSLCTKRGNVGFDFSAALNDAGDMTAKARATIGFFEPVTAAAFNRAADMFVTDRLTGLEGLVSVKAAKAARAEAREAREAAITKAAKALIPAPAKADKAAPATKREAPAPEAPKADKAAPAA